MIEAAILPTSTILSETTYHSIGVPHKFKYAALDPMSGYNSAHLNHLE